MIEEEIVEHSYIYIAPDIYGDLKINILEMGIKYSTIHFMHLASISSISLLSNFSKMKILQ